MFGIRDYVSGNSAYMDSNQARTIELLLEVHLIAFKEIERLNLRIAELHDQDPSLPQRTTRAAPAVLVGQGPMVNPAMANQLLLPSTPRC